MTMSDILTNWYSTFVNCAIYPNQSSHNHCTINREIIVSIKLFFQLSTGMFGLIQIEVYQFKQFRIENYSHLVSTTFGLFKQQTTFFCFLN